MPLNGKSVLITGGTGSFGRRFMELVLAQHQPKKLIVFSRDELKQDHMRQAYAADGNTPVRYFVGDIRDKERLHRAFHDVDVVIHAAALKQVPACEYNPFEAVQTNILGTRNVIDAAIDCGVRRVLALSTDKAVNPVNLYGATKLCAEKLVVQGNSYSSVERTRFSCARYGNVVGSRGSVIPLFLRQRMNGRVTVTDPRMTRFWITLDQSVAFIIRCLDMMQGGEVFVPRIPSMGIMDLIEAVAPDCEVEAIGIRPGEKINELLISPDEARHTFDLGDMYVIYPAFKEWHMDLPKGAQPLPVDFAYSSDTNDDWLSPARLRELVADL